MKKLFFLCLCVLILKSKFLSAGTINASLWENPNNKQKILLLGDQHGPYTYSENKKLWYEKNREQLKSFESIIKEINKTNEIEILVENLETQENLNKITNTDQISLLTLLNRSIINNPPSTLAYQS